MTGNNVITIVDPGAAPSRGRRGFTLIEILASMTILVFLVLMLTKVYTEGANAWKTGARNTYRNMTARAVMDYMARELSMATFEFGADPAKNFLSFGYNADVTPNNFGLEGADEVFFVRLNKDPDMSGDEGLRRSAELIRYYVANYLDSNGDPITNAPINAEYRFRLMRDNFHPETTPGEPRAVYFDNVDGLFWMGRTAGDRTQPSRRGEIIGNVRTFEIFTYLDEEGSSKFDWRSFDNTTDPANKLAFLDIYLETFDENDAIRAAALAKNIGPNHQTVVEFVERAVKRNYRRVYLYNKQGYQDKW